MTDYTRHSNYTNTLAGASACRPPPAVSDRRPPLHVCAAAGSAAHARAANVLLSRGASARAADGGGATALHVHCALAGGAQVGLCRTLGLQR